MATTVKRRKFETHPELDGQKLVHPKENLLFAFCVLISLIGLGGILTLPLWGELIQYTKKASWEAVWSIPFVIGALMYKLGQIYGVIRANSIQITENQFPEIHEMVVDFANKLGMKKVPEVYVLDGGGVLNAFAMTFFGRDIVKINSDIFEVAYREMDDLDTLGFIIAHELTHIHRGHTRFRYILLTLIARFVPFVGTALSRSREYTCDRHAAWLSPKGMDGILILTAGKHIYKRIDIDAYLEDTKSHKGFFTWLAHALSTHPVMTKRLRALRDLSTPGSVF